jgi:hypothetical protein
VIADPSSSPRRYRAAVETLRALAKLPAEGLPPLLAHLRRDAAALLLLDEDMHRHARLDRDRFARKRDRTALTELRAETAELLALEEHAAATPSSHRLNAAVDGQHVRLLRNRLDALERALAR